MKGWQLVVYGLGATADAATTYAALTRVPGAVELNPRIAPLLFTPLHLLAEVAAFTIMAAIFFAGSWLEKFNAKHGHARLGAWERRLIHAAVATVGAVRLAAAVNNILVLASAVGA